MNGNNQLNNTKGNLAGFTLVEVLVVALALAIIIGVGTGVFVSSIKIQRYNLKHQQVFSQISYLTEYMNRAIRMARKGDGVCIAEGESYEVLEDYDGIKFINYNGECQEFRLDKDFYLDTGYGRIISIIDSEERLISSDNFSVSLLTFYIDGSSDADKIQPRVTFFIEMTTLELNDQPKIRVQTTISKRNLDI